MHETLIGICSNWMRRVLEFNIHGHWISFDSFQKPKTGKDTSIQKVLFYGKTLVLKHMINRKIKDWWNIAILIYFVIIIQHD